MFPSIHPSICEKEMTKDIIHSLRSVQNCASTASWVRYEVKPKHLLARSKQVAILLVSIQCHPLSHKLAGISNLLLDQPIPSST